jgi:hypothetical protein
MNGFVNDPFVLSPDASGSRPCRDLSKDLTEARFAATPAILLN